MKLGYKEMLRDRTSKMQAVDLALKYCGAKTRWIDHVYRYFIGIYTSKKERNQATRIALGISNKNRFFDFGKTISWDNLDGDEHEYWSTVGEWVEWFQKNLLSVEQDIRFGATVEQIGYKYASSLDDPIAFAKYLVTNLS